MGLHGRRLDYPYLFENKYFTDYEIELQQENEALKKEIEELKKETPQEWGVRYRLVNWVRLARVQPEQ